jgi:membrane-associated phospholipid phosphatase
VYSWYRNRAFSQLAYSLIIVEIITYFIFLTFQTYAPRDPVLSDDIFSRLLRFIYYFDQPYNAFPSLHAALSALIATYFVCIKSKYSWAAVVFGILIVVSTLFTKQHYIVDAVSGVGLGIVVTWLVFKIQRRARYLD